MPLTRDLADFCAQLRYDDVPGAALPFIRTGFTDCFGTLVAGRYSDEARLLLEVLQPPPGESRLFVDVGTARAAEAAWLNATAAHALDLTMPRSAATSASWSFPRYSPKPRPAARTAAAMATAYAAGYETWAELMRREAGPLPQLQLASDRRARSAGRGRGLCQPAPAHCGADGARTGHRSFAKRRHDRELRQHDQALSRRPRSARGRDGRAAGRARLYRLARCTGASEGIAARHFARRPRGCRIADRGRARVEAAARWVEHQEISDVLCDASRAGRDARPSGGASRWS